MVRKRSFRNSDISLQSSHSLFQRSKSPNVTNKPAAHIEFNSVKDSVKSCNSLVHVHYLGICSYLCCKVLVSFFPFNRSKLSSCKAWTRHDISSSDRNEKGSRVTLKVLEHSSQAQGDSLMTSGLPWDITEAKWFLSRREVQNTTSAQTSTHINYLVGRYIKLASPKMQYSQIGCWTQMQLLRQQRNTASVDGGVSLSCTLTTWWMDEWTDGPTHFSWSAL